MVFSRCDTENTEVEEIIDDCVNKKGTNLTIGSEIGKGSFGVVYKGELVTDSGTKQVAIKIIDIGFDIVEELKDLEPSLAEQILKEKVSSFAQECNISEKMGIAKIGPEVYNTLYTRSGKGLIVMDYYPHSLSDVLKNKKIDIDDKINCVAICINLIIKQIFETNIYCTDIKPDNFVVDEDLLDARMIDFGIDWCSTMIEKKYECEYAKDKFCFFYSVLIQFSMLVYKTYSDIKLFRIFFRVRGFSEALRDPKFKKDLIKIFETGNDVNIHRFYLTNIQGRSNLDKLTSAKFTDFIIERFIQIEEKLKKI